MRFHQRYPAQHTIQNGMQFKTYELFIWGIFHLIFLDGGWPRVTETVENDITDKGGLLYIVQYHEL